MGKPYFCLFLFFVVIEVIFITFQPLWLSWWVDANKKRPDADLGKWLGVYAVFGILALTFLGISRGYYLLKLIPSSASVLHYSILKATMRSPMNFISATDSVTLLNRFTQDMTFIDMQLPMSLLISTEGLGKTAARAILTCVSSGYMALCLPFLGALFYVQKFYHQASRQTQSLDLQAKSPLYTHLTETLDGVRTIRAFKWRRYFLDQNFGLLDLVQQPFYLILCFIACLATMLIALAVALWHSTSSSFLGVAMSAGAAAVPIDWPSDFRIEFKDVSASYQPSGPYVVQNVNLAIDAGEHIAICGCTGSGKFTLVALLLRLLEPKSGTVLVGDDKISSFPPETVRGRNNSLRQDP